MPAIATDATVAWSVRLSVCLSMGWKDDQHITSAALITWNEMPFGRTGTLV